MWELKIHMTLHLIQIYFLTKYLVENAENSISETLEAPVPSALASVNITLKWYYDQKLINSFFSSDFESAFA